MSKLRLMSQNQWNRTENHPAWEALGLDCSAKARMPGHVQILEKLLPDVLGGQEVNSEMYRYLKLGCMEKGLPYTVIWGNMTPIIYRADKLELLDSDYLVYPEHVEGFDGIFNDVLSKSCCLGVFRVKEDGKVFLFATTHLWWMNSSNPKCGFYRAGSAEVRAMQIKMAIEMIDRYQKKYDGCPVILVGDMNSGYYAKAIQYALNEGGFTHAHDAASEFSHDGDGYNTCAPAGPGEWERKPFEKAIDHILVKGLPENAVRRFDRYEEDSYRFLSDHSPVWIDIEL